MIVARLKSHIMRHEGYRASVYSDTLGVPTIGYGRNLRGVGISKEEALLMLENDLQRAITAAKRLFPTFDSLSDERQEVLVNMAFNLGEWRLSGFVKFRRAVTSEEWHKAKREMIDSKWANQVGERARELATQFETSTARP